MRRWGRACVSFCRGTKKRVLFLVFSEYSAGGFCFPAVFSGFGGAQIVFFPEERSTHAKGSPRPEAPRARRLEVVVAAAQTAQLGREDVRQGDDLLSSGIVWYARAVLLHDACVCAALSWFVCGARVVVLLV